MFQTLCCFILLLTCCVVYGGRIPTARLDEKVQKRLYQPSTGCPTLEDVITVQDVQDAFLNSQFAYAVKVSMGDTVPGTQFKVKFVHEDQFVNDNNGIRVYIAERGSTTVVAYRGTDSNDQLLLQAVGMIKDFDGVDDITAGTTTKVNQFFLNAFKLLFPGIRHRLVDQSRRYIITGHSLGGAMASLLALKMTEYDNGKMWENPRTCLITFGEPRVGNADFARLHDRLIPTYKKLRFVLQKDPVPHIPPWPTFLHHSREVLLDYERTWWGRRGQKYWRVCNKEEQLMCSNFYTLTPNINDHDLEAYGKFIMDPPEMFKDRMKYNRNSFESALMNSCQSTEKRSMQVVEEKFMDLTKRLLVAMDKDIQPEISNAM